jgi:transcriptional regulator with XRE-family HTH domain
VDEAAIARVFGENLRALRQEPGMSQGQLGKASGMRTTVVSRIERGERGVRLGVIVRLARALDVEAGRLLVGLDAPGLRVVVEPPSAPLHDGVRVGDLEGCGDRAASAPTTGAPVELLPGRVAAVV